MKCEKKRVRSGDGCSSIPLDTPLIKFSPSSRRLWSSQAFANIKSSHRIDYGLVKVSHISGVQYLP